MEETTQQQPGTALVSTPPPPPAHSQASVEVLRINTQKAMAEFGDPFASVAAYRHYSEIAKLFAASTFVPKAFQSKPSECLIALNIARRMGEDELNVMQNMFVVHGTPGFKTQFMIGRANRHGGLKSTIKWEVIQVRDLRAREVEEDALAAGKTPEEAAGLAAAERVKHPRRVQVTTQRSVGQGQKKSVTFEMPNIVVRAFAVDRFGELITAEVSTQMAIAEDWVSNPKYESMPDHMLKFRSAAFMIRESLPEVLLGYSMVEELEDRPDLQVTTGSRTDAFVSKLLGEGAVSDMLLQHVTTQGGGEGEEGEVIDVSAVGNNGNGNGAAPASAATDDGQGQPEAVQQAQPTTEPATGARPRLTEENIAKLRALMKNAPAVQEEAVVGRLGAPLADLEGEPGEAQNGLYTRALTVIRDLKGKKE